MASSQLSPGATTHYIVTFDSESNLPRFIPQFQRQSQEPPDPDERLLSTAFVADKTHPLWMVRFGYQHPLQLHDAECEREFAFRAMARIERKVAPRPIAVALAC